MSYCPTFYDYGNRLQLKGVQLDHTAIVRMFARALMQRAMSAFKWELPETWDRDMFLYTLYENGFVAIINAAQYGVIPQPCGLSGYNVFYRPTKVVIANPCLPGVGEIPINTPGALNKTDAALIKLQPDYGGVLDTVYTYSDLLGLALQDIGVNLINSKLSYVMAAENKAAAESLKQLYADIAAGKPAVVVDKKLFRDDGSPAWMFFAQDVGNNFIAPKLLDVVRSLLDSFDTEIGLPNANTQKKERMIVDEVNANNAETASRCELWMDTVKTGIDQTLELFPEIRMGVEWRFKPAVESVDGGADDD